MAILVLLGWVFDVDQLKSVMPQWVSVKVNGAIAFLLAAVSLWLLAPASGEATPARRRAAHTLAAVVAVIAVATLLEYILGVDLHIDQALFRDAPGAVGTIEPGRMSPQGALGFLLIASALLTLRLPVHLPLPLPLSFPRIRARRVRLDALLLLPVMLVALLSFASYLYGAPALHTFSGHTGIALHGAFAFAVLAVGILAARPDNNSLQVFIEDSLGGGIARRLIPWVIIGPILLGFIRLKAQQAGYFGTEFGLAVFATSNVVVFGMLAWWTANSISKAEVERALSEKRFRQVAENMTEVFFVMDPWFRETLYINPAYERIWGRSCQSLHDNPSSFLEPIAAEDRPAVIEKLDRIVEGDDPGDIEFRIVHDDGSVRWILAHAVPVRNPQGEVYCISGVALDITERRKAADALGESRTRYQNLTEASFDGIVISQDDIIRAANPGFLKMFGYDRDEEVIGRPSTDFANREYVDDANRRATTGLLGQYEIIGKRKDGGKLLLEVTTRADTMGGRPARISALRDVTEKRSLEEQFRQAQKMEAVGRLAGGVAHDFNNLLTVISGNTELVLEQLQPGDPSVDDLKQILAAATGATSLTQQLLAFSRQQVIEPKTIALGDVVLKTNKMLRHLIGEDIDVATNIGGAPCIVFIDPGQLEQVLMNLAVNARDAMPTGGKLTIETSIAELDEASASRHWPASPGRFALLAVSDNGAGMDAVTRAKIFEPFFTTKEQGKGTGLGLATVYGIVKQSGGYISVYSEPGMGTTFRIYLPLVAEALESDAEPIALQLMPTGFETVLLVEDSDGVRGIARRILVKQGYSVMETGSPVDALAMANRPDLRIQLLLTDVVMPQMSGRELAERFAPMHPQSKILYMSGYTDDAIVRHGVLSAGVSYIQKPFTPNSLARKVRDVLDAV